MHGRRLGQFVAHPHAHAVVGLDPDLLADAHAFIERWARQAARLG
jgi:hypothetical protein